MTLRTRVRSAAVGLIVAVGAVVMLQAAGAQPRHATSRPPISSRSAARKTVPTPQGRGKTAPPASRIVRRGSRVPPRAPAELPVVDRLVSTGEGCIDPATAAILSPRLGAPVETLQAFLAAGGVSTDVADTCLPYVVVTGGIEGVASLHLAGASWQLPSGDPVPPSTCEPTRRVIEMLTDAAHPGQAAALADVPERIRWAVQVLVPDMAPPPAEGGGEVPQTLVRLVLERRGVADPERLRSIEILDPVSRRRLDGAWWVERAGGAGVLFGMRGADYERLLWHSPVPFARVSRGVGPATRVERRIVRQGKQGPKQLVTRVVKPSGYHLGIDMMAERGTDVHAAADGAVAFAGVAPGFGNLVILDHGHGYSTYYAHLSAMARGMRPGDVLLRGDVLGLVGSTGHSTGPHLHFETRLRDDYIDPLNTSRQLEFWFLNEAEQAWIAQQILAPEPAVATGVPVQGVSLVVTPDGSGATRTEPWVAEPVACRAFMQLTPPERPELPRPVVRKPAAPRRPPSRRRTP